MSIVPKDHQGPTCAVKFYGKDLLFVGHGPILRVYNYKTGDVLMSKQIFKRNKIHGISFQRDTFAFYGGRSFSMLQLKYIMSEHEVLDEEKMVHDWIIAGEFSYNGLELFLLTAHNVVLSVDSYSCMLQWEKSIYGEKSILYSGSIKVTSRNEVHVNAGTVMGRVIVWNLFKEEVKHTLEAHAGPVFNVQVSNKNRYIVSCSDDRFIKLWDFQTGELLSEAYGHTARIWTLRFGGDEDHIVVSVSEDMTARTWSITEEKKLMPVHTYELHTGRHVWGLDIDSESKIAATGGNDGRVRLIDIDPKKLEKETEKFTIQQIVDDASADYQVQRGELIKGVWRLDAGLVMITSVGGIFFYKDSQWIHLRTDGDFNSLTLTNGYTKQNVVTFTNSKGQTLFLKFDDSGSIKNEKKITTSISKAVNAISAQDGEKLYLLVESPNKKDALTLYQFNSDLEITNTTHITSPPTFVTTCLEVCNDLVYVGYRLSSLGIYALNTGDELAFIKKLSLTDTVTSIRCIKDRESKSTLTITNRDGYYIYLDFDKISSTHSITHTNNARKGFLEGSLEINNELITYGFKSSYFYIYNESREYEIAYDSCGGAHRLWKLFYNEGAWELLYVRDSVLHMRTVPVPPTPLLLSEGTHGREVRSISFRGTPYGEDKKKALYVTGGEETLVKLGSVDVETGAVKHYWTMRKHTSGLQKIKFLNNELVASSSAREEFFVWKVTETDAYPLVSLIGTLHPSSDNPDLRIMDFDHEFVYDGEEVMGVVLCNVYSDSSIKTFYFDLQTYSFTPIVSGRYKTCCILDVKLIINGGRVLVLTGATDGHLAIWDITSEIQHVAVDGKLQHTELLESKPLPQPLTAIAVHQNGIKSFVVIEREYGLCVITSGDDNALGLTKFIVGDQVTAEVSCHIADAASSLITSLSHVSGERVLAISVDQVIKLWSFKGDQLVLLDKVYTTVADTGSSDSLQHPTGEFALVGGAGLSFFEVLS